MIPVPGYGVGTPYGARGPYWSCNEDANGNGIHTGVDYPSPTGTRVVAARGGKVVYCDHGDAFGNHQLEIVPGDGTRDFYAHMTTRTPANGSHIDAGATVGKVGAEGNVTGPHLHFERHAVSSGGWNCAIIRDPAPSINYQPSGGSGGGTGEDDVLNSDDKDWIKKQIANSQQAVIDRMNDLMGDVVSNPKPDDDDNTVMAKTALGMLLKRTN